MAAALKFLDDLPAIDWSDLAAVAPVTRHIVQRLANDPVGLGALVRNTLETPEFLRLCEHHELVDKIVVYDALDRGIRLRLHLSTDVHRERPHDHRFSFTTYIIRGSYTHTYYSLNAPPDALVTDDTLDFAKLHADFESEETRGACYTLHHSVIHTTVTTTDTVSLFLRGPVEKSRSLIGDLETGKMWWRYGENDEDADRRHAVSVTRATVEQHARRLHDLGIIQL